MRVRVTASGVRNGLKSVPRREAWCLRVTVGVRVRVRVMGRVRVRISVRG